MSGIKEIMNVIRIFLLVCSVLLVLQLRCGLFSVTKVPTIVFLIATYTGVLRDVNIPWLVCNKDWYLLSFDAFFLRLFWPRAHHLQITTYKLLVSITGKVCFTANNILLLHNWNQLLRRKIADFFLELAESDWSMKTNLLIEWWHNY